jgi:hypothetical protein
MQQLNAALDSTYFMAVAVIRKVTEDGAVLVGQRLFSPKGVLSISHFDIPCRERDWDLILDAACRECRIPGCYQSSSPRSKINRPENASTKDFISMVYPIGLDGPVADLFRTMGESVERGMSSDVLANVSRLMNAVEAFEDPLVTVFDSLTAKIRFLKIPTIIPFGQSELDVYEEQNPQTDAP